MKKNILLAVILLSSGLQMAAKDRDLVGMKNFKELSNIPYDKLTQGEKQQVIAMAVKSMLVGQRSGARSLINKKFKLSNQEWTKLENMATNEGLNAVNAYFDKLGGGSKAPSPAGGVIKKPVEAVAEKPADAQLAVLPQDVKNLIDEFANLVLQYNKKSIDINEKNQDMLAHINTSIAGGAQRDVAIDGAKDILNAKIDEVQRDLTETQNRIATYGTELKALGLTNADIDKIHDAGLARGGVNQAAHDLLEKLQELQLQQQPEPLVVIPGNL